MPETAYATRAKLTMPTPPDHDKWIAVNDRIRTMPDRKHLLVSNTGPKQERSEEPTSELQSLMRISYAVFCLKQKTEDQLSNYTIQKPNDISKMATHRAKVKLTPK